MSYRNFKSLLTSFERDISELQEIHPDFPHASLKRAQDEITFESAYAVLDDILSWSRSSQERSPDAAWASLLSRLKDARVEIDSALDCFEASETGGLIRLPDEAPETGRPRYHSLGNAALYHDFDVSVFGQKFRATPVYDGKEALEAQLQRRPLPAPVGVVADYRVVIRDGELLHPPRSPSDLQREYEEDPSPSP